jgi:hypothetical protein
LTTIYQGVNKLTAFVPPSLASALASNGINVVNLSTTPAQSSLPPVISGINPSVITAGASIFAILTGSNLGGATAVSFSGNGVTASIQGGSANQLNLTLTASASATPGLRSVTVTTPSGSFTATSLLQVQDATTGIPTSVPAPIAEVEQGNIRSGYVIVTPDSNSAAPAVTATFGIVSNGLVQSQAGIIPGSMPTDASMFVAVIPAIGRNLGVAMANPASNSNTITMTLSDSSGATAGPTATVVLQPQQQLARFVNELFPSAVGNGFQGNLRLQSSTPFAVLGLRFSGIEFSTLPVSVNATSGAGVTSRPLFAGSVANSPLAGVVGGSAAIILPQFAMGGGWATQLALVNNGSTSITGRVDVFDTAGNPMAVKLNGSTQSTFTYSILPGGSFVIAPRDNNGQSPF